MHAPMYLFHQQIRLGLLTNYGYATPWAEAWLQADDPAIMRRYAAIYAFHNWVETLSNDLTDEESDVRYLAELRRRGLDEAQVESVMSGWEIQMPDGEIREISVYGFEDDGYITWRW